MLHDQSQLVAVKCLINNITRKGAAFAGTENGESVFISIRLVEQFHLDVGDAVTCWCEDQSAVDRPEGAQHSARWKAMRLKVDRRLSDAVGDDLFTPAPQSGQAPITRHEPAVQEKPVVPAMTPSTLKEKVMLLMQKPRCWTTRQMADEIATLYGKDYIIPDEIGQKVSALLFAEHKNGDIASCRVMRVGAQDKASSVYYARSTNVFDDLLDGYEVEE